MIDILPHILFLESQMRYHENQIAWAADNPPKQKAHLALLSGLRAAADCIKLLSEPTTDLSKNSQRHQMEFELSPEKSMQPLNVFNLKSKRAVTFDSSKKNGPTTQKNKRTSRGEPKFEILRDKLYAHYPDNSSDSVTFDYFKFIVEALDKETDSSGRIRWGKAAFNDLKKSRSGIHPYKVTIVRLFLINNKILQAESNRIVYVDDTKVPLKQQALATWQKNKEKKSL